MKGIRMKKSPTNRVRRNGSAVAAAHQAPNNADRRAVGLFTKPAFDWLNVEKVAIIGLLDAAGLVSLSAREIGVRIREENGFPLTDAQVAADLQLLSELNPPCVKREGKRWVITPAGTKTQLWWMENCLPDLPRRAVVAREPVAQKVTEKPHVAESESADTVTIVLTLPDGSGGERIDLPAPLFAAVKKAAKRIRISLNEFFNRAIAAKLPDWEKGGVR